MRLSTHIPLQTQRRMEENHTIKPIKTKSENRLQIVAKILQEKLRNEIVIIEYECVFRSE